MIEYGLIAALVALVVIGAVSLLGTNLQSPFNTLNGTFGNGGEGGGGSPTQATGQSL